MASSQATTGTTSAGRAARRRSAPGGASRPSKAASAKRGNGKGTGGSLARGMGWFSLALGATELVAPRVCARFIGAPETPSSTRLLGLREIASGVGILSEKRPVGWMWSRVAGDVMDLAYLGAAFGARNARAGPSGSSRPSMAGAIDSWRRREPCAAREARLRPNRATPVTRDSARWSSDWMESPGRRSRCCRFGSSAAIDGTRPWRARCR